MGEFRDPLEEIKNQICDLDRDMSMEANRLSTEIGRLEQSLYRESQVIKRRIDAVEGAAQWTLLVVFGLTAFEVCRWYYGW